MKNYSLLVFTLLIVCLSLSSCLTSKRVVYLQGDGFKYNESMMVNTDSESYRLQVNDILNIRVVGPDAILSDVFNIQASQQGGGAGGGNVLGTYLNSYVVDEKGSIKVPLIGEVSIIGLTIKEVEQKLEERLRKEYLNDVTVIVRMTNFVVSVLGAVARPGRFPVYQEKISVFEALAMSGDLDEFASRKNIKLIRQQGSQLEIRLIDITRKDFLTSSFYYLKPNDLIYVEPMKAKLRRSNLPLLGTIFSGVSATVLILNFINNSRR
jgi:polysaccharide export outer membrane protein